MNVSSTNPKFHLSLDVKSVEDSVRFYSILFGTSPTKVKPGYAKFDLAQPAVNLTLQENAPCCITGLSHMGVRVDSTEQVLEAKQRLQAAGVATFEETNTTCCYAIQDKIWVTDPTGYRWEVYVFKGYSDATTSAWAGLTGYIALTGSIPALNTETVAADEKRLTAAFERTHGGDVNAFVAELQFSFIRWWIHVWLNQEDEAAQERWIHLVNALYNAGEFMIRETPALFLAVVPVLLTQLSQLPDTAFAPNSAFTGQADYLAEDLTDSEMPELVAQGKKLRDYLESRRP